MTTKKADTTKSVQRLERGRFAKLLADGYTIEVKRSPKRATSQSTTSESPANSQPRRATRPFKA
jgi:hypothetical protein